MPKIFESPDGGKTVYSRSVGDLDRELEWEDPRKKAAMDILKERQEWSDIIEAAKNNPALQEAIDRVKILYYLSKNNGQK